MSKHSKHAEEIFYLRMGDMYVINTLQPDDFILTLSETVSRSNGYARVKDAMEARKLHIPESIRHMVDIVSHTTTIEKTVTVVQRGLRAE